jgi:8-oxo-dGTP pyrophosphatase MutT (NUDIX family)
MSLLPQSSCVTANFCWSRRRLKPGLAFNQPAGHLEAGESLIDAVIRETLEETAYHFKPTHLIGVYNWKHPGKDVTYLRFAFGGELRGFEAERELDEGIVAARWLTLDEVKATQARHRSPLILRCIEDQMAGKTCPLNLLVHYA